MDAEAYRTQIGALGLEPDARGVFAAEESSQARRHALMMKLGLLDQPITPKALDPLLAAWRESKAATGALTVVRSSALVEDRFGSSFAGQFESFLGIEEPRGLYHLGSILLGCAVGHARTALYGDARHRSCRHCDGNSGPAAGLGSRVGRRIEASLPKEP